MAAAPTALRYVTEKRHPAAVVSLVRWQKPGDEINEINEISYLRDVISVRWTQGVSKRRVTPVRTAASCLVKLDEQLQTGLMVDMLPIKDRDQD
jgi:hypothetical protein